jgi:hypothetical protein
MKRIDLTAQWWDDEESVENAGSETIDLRAGYSEDTLYIDGLREDGKYLALPLEAVARAIAAGSAD